MRYYWKGQMTGTTKLRYCIYDNQTGEVIVNNICIVDAINQTKILGMFYTN